MGIIYQIKRGSTTVLSAKLNGQQIRSVMAEDRVMMNFTLPAAVKFKRGDTVVAYGQTYKINRLPNDHETNTEFGVRYDLEFEALYYDLGKWKLRGLGPTNQLTQTQVDLRGNATAILDLVVRNANRRSSGWTVGVVDVTDLDQFSYSGMSLLAVLQDLANRYSTEFWVQGKVINLSRRQVSSGLTLGFGMGKGLYTLSREKTDHVPINYLNVYGGTQNIPSTYGFDRLQLPLANRPALSVPPATGEDVIEDDLFLENIFPTRKGALTGVSGELLLVDSTIDFNIPDYENNGKARIAFVSGQLTGFEFNIESYNHTTKQIRIERIVTDKAYPDGVPNVLLKAAVGDEYVLLNLDMPQSYITSAELKLLASGQRYFNDAIEDKFNYRANLTPIWVKQQAPNVELGYTVILKSVGREIDKTVRISAYTRDLQEDYVYPQFTLSDLIEVSKYARELQSQREVQQFIKNSNSEVKDAETLQTVARRGATTDRILTAKGLRATDLLVVPDKPSTEVGAMWYAEGTDAPPVPDYILPIATASILGGIKVGNGLTIDPNTGVLSSSFNPAGYATENWVNANYVPKTRKINGKLLNDDIALTAADVGALTQSTADGRYIRNQTVLQVGANFHVESGIFTKKLTIPNVEDSSLGAIYYAEGTGALPIPDYVLPIASATVLGGIKIGNGLSIDANGVVKVTDIAVDAYTKSESDAMFAAINDQRILNGDTAFGWGNHALAGYYNNSNLRAKGWGNGVAIEDNPDFIGGGHISNYGVTNWLPNSPFSGYGGVVAFRMNGSGVSGLELRYDIGRNSATGGRLAFRTVAGDNDTTVSYKPWKELYHTGNLRSNTENDARYLFTAGNHINITGLSLSVKLNAGTWLEDNIGNQRMYTSATSTNDFIFRLAHAQGRYTWRDASSSPIATLNYLGEFVTPSGVFATRLVIPSVASTVAGAIHYADGTGAIPNPDYILPIATASILGGVKIGQGLTINPETGVLSANTQTFDGWTKSEADARFEFSFTKRTGFNKNFGAVAGTVMEGNDTRVVQAFGWGNHAGKYVETYSSYDENADLFLNSRIYRNNTGLGGNYQYGSLLTLRSSDTGAQLSIQHTTGNMRVRGMYNSGANFSSWRNLWHDGNFNPSDYLLTGGTAYNSTRWNNQVWNGANTVGVATLMMGYTGSEWRPATPAQVGAFIGLGDYLPLIGGELTGRLRLNSPSADKLILIGAVGEGNNYIDFINNLGERRGYLGFATLSQDFYYRLEPGSGRHVFVTNGTQRFLITNSNVESRLPFIGTSIQATTELLIPSTPSTKAQAIWYTP